MVYKCFGCDSFHLQPLGHEEQRGKYVDVSRF
jgi:hypothetical protein